MRENRAGGEICRPWFCGGGEVHGPEIRLQSDYET